MEEGLCECAKAGGREIYQAQRNDDGETIGIGITRQIN